MTDAKLDGSRRQHAATRENDRGERCNRERVPGGRAIAGLNYSRMEFRAHSPSCSVRTDVHDRADEQDQNCHAHCERGGVATLHDASHIAAI